MYEKIIEGSILSLLVYLTLAFGGVSEGSIALLKLVAGLLVGVWLLKLVADRHHVSRHARAVTGQVTLRLVMPALIVVGGFFGLVLALQLLPFPAGVVKWLSPSTYRLYAETATIIGWPLPSSLPLTVCFQATRDAALLWLAYLLIFLVMLNTIRAPQQLQRMMAAIIALGVFEALYGLFEYVSGRNQIFGFHKTSGFFVSGTFVNKNHFAGFMELVIPLTCGLLFLRLQEPELPSAKLWLRLMQEKYMKILLLSFLFTLMIAALLFSGSRAGIVSFGGGMIGLLLLASSRRLLRRAAVVLSILLLIALGGAVMMGAESLLARFQTLAVVEAETSFQFRQLVWQDTLRIVRDFPLFGTGLGTFAQIFPRYQSFPTGLTFAYAENDYLQLLAETGVIGLACALTAMALFFATTYTAWRKRHSRWSVIMVASGLSGVGSLLVHSVIDFNLHIPANALLFTIIAAMTTVAAHSRRRSPR